MKIKAFVFLIALAFQPLQQAAFAVDHSAVEEPHLCKGRLVYDIPELEFIAADGTKLVFHRYCSVGHSMVRAITIAPLGPEIFKDDNYANRQGGNYIAKDEAFVAEVRRVSIEEDGTGVLELKCGIIAPAECYKLRLKGNGPNLNEITAFESLELRGVYTMMFPNYTYLLWNSKARFQLAPKPDEAQ